MQGQSWQFALLCLPGLAEGRGRKVSMSKVDGLTLLVVGQCGIVRRDVAGRQQT